MTAEVLAGAQAMADHEGEQGEAVRLLNSHALALLEGPAGTGKTVVAGVLCEASRAARRRVALVAPTGLAAHNLSEVGRQPAETIHRFVGRVERGEAQAVDLVIADEASMISSELMRRLMRSSRDLPSPIRTTRADWTAATRALRCPSTSPRRPASSLLAASRSASRSACLAAVVASAAAASEAFSAITASCAICKSRRRAAHLAGP